VRPESSVRRSARQVPLAHGALPRTHPISRETKVTEFGSNPAGTDAPAGIAPGDAEGDPDGEGLGDGVITADGVGLGLREGVVGAVEHAASSSTDPATPASRRVIRTVRVISARNATIDAAVTTRLR
ncbi:MAG: hypothetical protein ACRD1G_03680, partial [Acidimicrobiales bacterium]